MENEERARYRPKDFTALSHRANTLHYIERSNINFSEKSLRRSIDPTYLPGFHFCKEMELFDPLLELFPGASWATLGDGKGGKEALYLQDHGAKVLPTDSDDSILRRAQSEGVFQTVKAENAESLSFGDDSFDFTFCKETLHHLPRPFAAIYEMLRVSRKGFAFIEPADRLHPYSLQWHSILENHFRKLEQNPNVSPYDLETYESAGNYAYCFNIREIEKLALGAGLRWFAYKGVHTQNLSELKNSVHENTKASQEELAFQEYCKVQLEREMQSAQGTLPWGSYAFLVFTIEVLPEGLVEMLTKKGWKVCLLPQNPYLHVNMERAAKSAQKLVRQ
ncbi:MAG: class I SAM-dependent methyltransferase [Bdellovibrionales bacterium]|nr:class I SAM-dependent methyltransferase [Bdellovibrionales bacterium]